MSVFCFAFFILCSLKRGRVHTQCAFIAIAVLYFCFVFAIGKLCGKRKWRTGQNDEPSNEGSGEGKSLNYYNASLYRSAARFWYFDLCVFVFLCLFFCVNVLFFYWKTRPTTRFMAIFVWEKRRMGAFAFRSVFLLCGEE